MGGWARRQILSCLAVALVIFSARAVPPPASILSTQSGCDDVLLIGARGSGQSAGLGPEVARVRDGLKAQLGDHRTVGQYALDYPAESVDVLKSRPLRFFNGLWDGVQSAEATIKRRAADCPRQLYVLAGYSQGAMVMHRLLIRLVHQDRTRLLARIAGVALIADGDRVRRSVTLQRGTAAWEAIGIATRLIGPPRDIPDTIAQRTYSLCDDSDLVCDFAESNIGSSRAKAVHENYRKDARANGIGRAIAARALAYGQPRKALFDPTLRDGDVSTFTLRAKAATETVQWRLNGGALPPGLSLRRSGAISGTPTEQGLWTSQVAVRGRFDVWLPATLKISVARARTGSQVYRTEGPHGFSTEATLAPCPAPAAGLEMYIVDWASFRDGYNRTPLTRPGWTNSGWYWDGRLHIILNTDGMGNPDEVTWNIACVEAAPGAPHRGFPTGGVTRRTYDPFKLTFTRGTWVESSPQTANPGTWITIASPGGCVAAPDPQTVEFTIMASGTNAILPQAQQPPSTTTGLDGHWNAVTWQVPVDLPAGGYRMDAVCTVRDEDGDLLSAYNPSTDDSGFIVPPTVD